MYSKFISWKWYKDTNTKTLFLHCLLKANWKDGMFENIEVPRGSFVTSLETLSKELGLSIQEIRTSLKHLISTNELTNNSTNKYRLITVVNYELYQINENQLTNEQQTTNKQKSEFSTNELTNKENKTKPEFIGVYEELKNENNKQPNIQLTSRNEANQQQYKNISVCNNKKDINNTRVREIICHLGSEFKTKSCVGCLKKNICDKPVGEDFKIFTGYETFEEYDKKRNEKIEEKIEKKEPVLFDYDWLNEE